jgi:hypothetical protein
MIAMGEERGEVEREKSDAKADSQLPISHDAILRIVGSGTSAVGLCTRINGNR